MNVWVWSRVISLQLCCSGWFPKTGLKGTSPIPKRRAGSLDSYGILKASHFQARMPCLEQTRPSWRNCVASRVWRASGPSYQLLKIWENSCVWPPTMLATVHGWERTVALPDQRSWKSQRRVLTISSIVQKCSGMRKSKDGDWAGMCWRGQGEYMWPLAPENSQPIQRDRCMKTYW